MHAFIAFAVFLALGPAAQAKPAPLEPEPMASSLADVTMVSGASGALLESAYFLAPQPAFAAGRIFPCRLQLRVFEKKQLAQSCN